jgi:hypothetical protein
MASLVRTPIKGSKIQRNADSEAYLNSTKGLAAYGTKPKMQMEAGLEPILDIGGLLSGGLAKLGKAAMSMTRGSKPVTKAVLKVEDDTISLPESGLAYKKLDIKG